jgi:hypothetical protein
MEEIFESRKRYIENLVKMIDFISGKVKGEIDEEEISEHRMGYVQMLVKLAYLTENDNDDETSFFIIRKVQELTTDEGILFFQMLALLNKS